MTAEPMNLMLPVRPCEPWCEDGEEKHDGQHPEDRSCWSEYQTVPLTNHKPERRGDAWWLDWLNVYLRRRPEDAAAVVYLNHEEDDSEIVLTLGEARKLADALSGLVDLAQRTS